MEEEEQQRKFQKTGRSGSEKIYRQKKGELMKSACTLSALGAVFTAALIGITPMASHAADSANSTTNTASVSTQDKPSNYVVLKAGIYSPSMSFDIDNAAGGTTVNNGRVHMDSKTGFAGEIAVGHYFLPMLALELGGGYFESKGSPAAAAGESKLRVVPLIATGKVFLPLGIFEPYGLAGIGAYITDLDVSINNGTSHTSTEVTYGFHAGAGFNINFNRNMYAGLEGKYLWAEPSFGGDHIKLDGFITNATIGYRF
jgi:outer membrane protein W